jgi:hypothetical protein
MCDTTGHFDETGVTNYISAMQQRVLVTTKKLL